MTSNCFSLKRIAAAATLTVASLAFQTPVFGGEASTDAETAFYRHQIEQQIHICQAKSALQFSRFRNVRELGRKYGLKLAYLTRQQNRLVTEMANDALATKGYRVSRFITDDFHRALEKYNLARR